MTVITPYELRKKLYEVNKMSSNPNNIYSPSTQNLGGDNDNIDSQKFSLEQVTITKVSGNEFISEDNRRWLLYNAIPGVDYVCRGLVANGVCTLENQLRALGITDGTNNFLIGVNGATDEFEIRIMADETKVQVRKDYVSIQTPHLMKQGLEEK